MATNGNDHIQVYGKYSLGSGSVLSEAEKLYSEVGNPDVIEKYKMSINRDMRKAGIPLSDLHKFKVMDVGTGRQAIAFYSLGADFVSHFDLSERNVERMKLFIGDNALYGKINTENADLVERILPREDFDLVFLHGIVQHFSHTGKGLLNCLNAVKPGGYVSLYFYRSGTFFNFLVYLIRDLIKGAGDYREFFISSILLFTGDCHPNRFVSDIMDSLFVPYMHLYTPNSYIDFVKACGFDIISSSKLDPYGKAVDHTYAYPSVILTCRKTAQTATDSEIAEILSPEKSVNQLDASIYSECDRHIIKTIDAYSSLKKLIAGRNVPHSIIIALAFKLYRFLFDLGTSLDKKIDEDEGEKNHEILKNIFLNTQKLLEEEY